MVIKIKQYISLPFATTVPSSFAWCKCEYISGIQLLQSWIQHRIHNYKLYYHCMFKLYDIHREATQIFNIILIFPCEGEAVPSKCSFFKK